jgi:L-alanine-DL-glutamate epimerase-like enolase superfamily enzyme
MRVTNVSLTLFRWEGIPTTRYGIHTGLFGGSSQLGLLAIETDDGLTGHAFLGSSTQGAELDGQTLVHHLKPILMNEDPLARERLYRKLWLKSRQTSIRAIGAVDIALWDIAGKAAALPIHKLIGSYRDSLPAYASSPILPGPEAYAEEALRIRGEGWAAYKIHPPTDPTLDIAVCRAVRGVLGDDFTIMLDSTWAYQYPDALRVGKEAEELGFYWYEDPLEDDDVLTYVKLKQQLSIPILATEQGPNKLTSYATWLLHQATDYLRGDVAVKGGISACLKASHLAEAFHMNYEIHHGGNSLNNVANLHVSMAISNCEFFEVLLPSEAQKYGLVEDIPVENGMVRAFDKPGLGAEIDFGLIERNKIAVLS